MDMNVPPPMAGWVASLPQVYVGTLYAKIRSPYLPWGTWYKVPVWGQVADGRAHEDSVANFLYNEFPSHGKGYTYVEWRNEPSDPEHNNAARSGLIENPKPFEGKSYYERSK